MHYFHNERFIAEGFSIFDYWICFLDYKYLCWYLLTWLVESIGEQTSKDIKFEVNVDDVGTFVGAAKAEVVVAGGCERCGRWFCAAKSAAKGPPQVMLTMELTISGVLGVWEPLSVDFFIKSYFWEWFWPHLNFPAKMTCNLSQKLTFQLAKFG